MSELRATILKKDARQATNSNKASGDTVTKKKSIQQKTINSIPKNLRFDLENALVGLCDVWFEEIKPYLVRNNIKLHVHANAGDGDREHSPSSHECSHNDPGRSNHRRRTRVSCADSSTTRRSASKAQCRRPPAPELVVLDPPEIQSPRYSKKETVRKPHKRRKCREQTESRHLVPRLCRTYSVQPCTEPYPVMKPPIPHLRNTSKFLPGKRKCKKLDASTQTEIRMVYVKNTVTDKSISANGAKFTRSPSTATFLLSKQNIRRNEVPLFKNDLLDIIAEKYDKKLEVLYTSPRTDEYPSLMNLFSPSKGRCKTRGLVRTHKVPPWK